MECGKTPVCCIRLNVCTVDVIAIDLFEVVRSIAVWTIFIFFAFCIHPFSLIFREGMGRGIGWFVRYSALGSTICRSFTESIYIPHNTSFLVRPSSFFSMFWWCSFCCCQCWKSFQLNLKNFFCSVLDKFPASNNELTASSSYFISEAIKTIHYYFRSNFV